MMDHGMVEVKWSTIPAFDGQRRLVVNYRLNSLLLPENKVQEMIDGLLAIGVTITVEPREER